MELNRDITCVIIRMLPPNDIINIAQTNKYLLTAAALASGVSVNTSPDNNIIPCKVYRQLLNKYRCVNCTCIEHCNSRQLCQSCNSCRRCGRSKRHYDITFSDKGYCQYCACDDCGSKLPDNYVWASANANNDAHKSICGQCEFKCSGCGFSYPRFYKFRCVDGKVLCCDCCRAKKLITADLPYPGKWSGDTIEKRIQTGEVRYYEIRIETDPPSYYSSFHCGVCNNNPHFCICFHHIDKHREFLVCRCLGCREETVSKSEWAEWMMNTRVGIVNGYDPSCARHYYTSVRTCECDNLSTRIITHEDVEEE